MTSTSCRRRSAGSSATRAASGPDDDIDRQRQGDRDDAFYVHSGPERLVFDYSADGVTRSLEESLERLGVGRIDIALIHDPDDHWQAAIDGAYPALARLREQGVIRAVGAGMNQSEMLARFVRETDIDVVLVAGRYTILDQGALDELLPACEARGVAVLVGGVMNSGVLAEPRRREPLQLRAGPGRGRRTGATDRRRCATATGCRSGPPRCSSRSPTLPSRRSSIGVRSVEHLDEYPRFARRRSRRTCGRSSVPRACSAADAPVPA